MIKDTQPLKFVYGPDGEVTGLAEFSANDVVPARYLNLNVEIDGGSAQDTFQAMAASVDGGVCSDVFTDEQVEYNGGSIL